MLNADSKNNSRFLTGFGAPFGVHQDTEGRLFVADLRFNEVFVLDSDYKKIGVLRLAGLTHEPSPTCFHGPHSISHNSKGEIFVCAYYQKKIFKFSKDLKHGEVFLDHQTVPIEWLLTGPATVNIGPDDRLYVSDYSSSSLQRFASDGRFLDWLGFDPQQPDHRGWKTSGRPKKTKEDSGFDQLHDIVFDSVGCFYIADTRNERVLKFKEDGHLIGWNGKSLQPEKIFFNFEGRGQAMKGTEIGALDGPTSVDFFEGKILITNLRNNRLDLIDTSGNFIKWFGAKKGSAEPGAWRTDGESQCGNQEGAFSWPYDAKFISGTIAVADSRNSRVDLVPYP